MQAVFEGFFEISVVFGFVRFKYAATLMLVPKILIDAFQAHSIRNYDCKLQLDFTDDFKEKYIDSHTCSFKHRMQFNTSYLSILFPFILVILSYMLQLYFYKFLILKNQQFKSMREYFMFKKVATLIYIHDKPRQSVSLFNNLNGKCEDIQILLQN